MAKYDLNTIRHSAAHLMAAAVQELYPDTKFDIGPATENGFYYDFDLPSTIVDKDLKQITKAMIKMQNKKIEFECIEMSREEAETLLKEKDQTYKLERLADVPDGDKITFYKLGEFMDLCRGPHVEHTGQIGVIKLMSIAGSYYRGDEKNKMLQRIYGTAFTNKKELNEYLRHLEEAAKRDHRKLGKELDLFSMSDKIGPGLVLWHPKGANIRSTIESYWKDNHYANGYEQLYTPHVGKSDLWKTSGHLDFYTEGMYSPMQIDKSDYYAKPMNCPFHIEIYKATLRSYRELPLRWAELGTVYRYEKSGSLHGLLRVRGFTQDDAHIICSPEQVEDEIFEVLRFCLATWKDFGFDNIKAYLATRPAEKSVGEQEHWDTALVSLEKAIKKSGMPYEVDEGGGAFYGPKIDLKIKDAIGREWQTSTIQFDFNLPERFDMNYTGSDGKKHRPYMIHRALFGSIERFFAILIEHYSGAFPLWLAPEQVRVLPISDNQLDYSKNIVSELRKLGYRAELDSSSDRIGGKIKNARNARLPYIITIGDNEIENKTLSVRSRKHGQLESILLDDLLEKMSADIAEKN